MAMKQVQYMLGYDSNTSITNDVPNINLSENPIWSLNAPAEMYYIKEITI